MLPKTLRASILFCFTIIFITACSEGQEQAFPHAEQHSPVIADIVLTDGYIYTVDANRRVAQALAVAENRIVAVGRNSDMQSYIGADTRLIDLDGRMVMPGLHDAHIHALGIVEPDMCDFNSRPMSLEDMVPFLQGCIEHYRIPPGEWLVVLQWAYSYGNQPSDKYPTIRAALDAVSSEHPVFLWGNDGHHGAANSIAMALARSPDGVVTGINRDTINTVFADYRELIAVDEQGNPSGGLTEGVRLLVRPEFDEDMHGIRAAPESVMPRVAAKLAANGITSIQDPLVLPEAIAMYKWLEDSGMMTFRLRAALFHQPQDSHSDKGLAHIPEYIREFKQLRAQYHDSKFIRPEAVKLFADGVLEGNPLTRPPTLPVAAMLNGFRQPIFSMDDSSGGIDVIGYVDVNGASCQAVNANPDAYTDEQVRGQFLQTNGYLPAQCKNGYGVLEYSEIFIREFVRQATGAGFHVHIHALADRGVRAAVDAFEEVKALAAKAGLTQSLAHLQVVHPDDQRRIGEIGIYNVFTYAWIIPDPEYDMTVIPFIDEVKGITDLYNPDHYYMQNVYPVKSIQDAGGIAVFGSDAPVDSRDPMPFRSMQQAVTRSNGELVYNAGQRLSIHDVIASFTINSARLLGHDKDLGTIETGKIADLIVLNQNVVELAQQGRAGKIGETLVDLTIFDGKIVFERNSR